MTASCVYPPQPPTISSIDIHLERGSLDVIDKLADEWRNLCNEAVDDQPFYRPEWIGAYLRAFVPSGKILMTTARLDGRLRLVLPLIEEMATYSKIPVRRLMTPVDKCAGRFDVIYSTGPDGEAAIQAVWNHLRKLEGWDLLYLRDALQGSAASRMATLARAEGLKTIEIEDRPSPIVAIPTDPNLRKLLPANARLRRELRSVRRQLSEQGSTLKLHRVETADPKALDRFYQLEASGWKGQEGTATLLNGVRPFLDEIAESAARFGYFTLYLLELNGELIAGHYGFTHRNCYYSVVVAYNESFREYSPGHLIISEIVEDCALRGILAYQTTGQDQKWKMRWTTQTQPLSQHYIFRGVLGNLAYTMAEKVKPNIGRLFARKSA